MSQVKINTPAPDFELEDLNGDLIRLSAYQEKAMVLLVFNRGFY